MNVPCPHCATLVETTESTAHCAACGSTFAVGEIKTQATASEPVDPWIGRRVGGCELIERIGAGGMGVVYKARQVSLGRTVAVKILPDSLRGEPGIEDRFQREISILAKLNHPNIVGILDGGFGEFGLYFVMEFVDGTSLRQVLTTGGLSGAEALKLIPQICDALEYAHTRGIVHRDIKPENILIDRDGRVRLLDFGLSRITGQESPEALTRATQVLGTFEYMAPEQREASKLVDHRADLYSLGVVLYELLTGELPIGRFDAPSKKNITIDVRLDEIVLRVLEKSPDRRYQRASDIKTEVERLSTTVPPPVVAAPPVSAVPPLASSFATPSATPVTPVATSSPASSLPPVPEIPSPPAMATPQKSADSAPVSRLATGALWLAGLGILSMALPLIAAFVAAADGRHGGDIAEIAGFFAILCLFLLALASLAGFLGIIRVAVSGSTRSGMGRAALALGIGVVGFAMFLVFCITLLLPAGGAFR